MSLRAWPRAGQSYCPTFRSSVSQLTLERKNAGHFLDASCEGRTAMREAGPREARPHSIRVAGLLLLATTAFVPSGSSFAGTVSQPVPNYLVLNPIDVCATGGTGCAPFNTLKTAPGAATA